MGFLDPIKALRQIIRHLQIANTTATMTFTGPLQTGISLWSSMISL